jgi:hypothetical protein
MGCINDFYELLLLRNTVSGSTLGCMHALRDDWNLIKLAKQISDLKGDKKV